MANQQVTTNKQFSLNLKDGIKGLIIAVGTPVLYMLQELIPGWNLDPLSKAAIAATVTYLLKNFFNKNEIVVTGITKETMESAKTEGISVRVTTDGNTTTTTKEATKKP